MRRGYYLSTALITTLGRDAPSADWPGLDALLDRRPGDDGLTLQARRISARSLCSDGEIFLDGDLPVRILIRS